MTRPRRPLRLLVLALTVSCAIAVPISGAALDTDLVDHHGDGRILVTFRPGTTGAGVRAAHATAHAGSLRKIAAVRTDVVAVDDVASALARYRARPEVEWAGEDGVVRAANHVSDNRFSSQWNLQDADVHPGSINWHPVYVPAAPFGEGVTVAVIDTGVGRSDPVRRPFDGFSKPLVAGFDFVNDDAQPDDVDGHGTHIAGTIAQQTGNPVTLEPDSGGASVAGIAPNASIMAVRVLDDVGSGSVSDTVAGIVFAVDHGANVVNLSLSGDYAKPLCDAVQYATSRNVLVVAASGNESEEGMIPVGYPAACPGALAVGGHIFSAERGSYSNGSCELAFSAPGGDLALDPTGKFGNPLTDTRNGILQETVDGSADGYGFYFDSGTSMAAAHATGAAAVLMGAPYNRSAADVASILRATARDRGLTAGQDDEYGAGSIDLAAAVAGANGAVAPPTDRLGYWMVASDGGIFSFGDAPFLGSTGSMVLNSPIVGMARTPTGRGYWMVAADGGIFTFGDARFFGSAGSIALKAPIVGLAPSATGAGYWLVGADGGIFAFGDARYFGSAGALQLNRPIVGMAATRSGQGYWLVASDGGIFAFGNALFRGSTGNLVLNAPIVGITRTPSSAGYWLVATDGGIFAFGDASFHGSTGDIRLNKPIIGMIPTCFGGGYWLVASDGGVFSFGAAPFLGSTGNIALNKPIVGALVATDHRAAQR